MDVHIGRQAIFDPSDAALGYELLFRDDGSAETAGSTDHQLIGDLALGPADDE
jgi:c-di-GMP-related signal transduction protein